MQSSNFRKLILCSNFNFFIPIVYFFQKKDLYVPEDIILE